MSDEPIFVRIEAEDYANVVTRLFTARRRLRECERAASEAAGQWTDELRGVLEEFNRFRRAVQEGLGFDQPELYHDNELIQMIRSAVTRAHLRRPLAWQVPTGPAATLSDDAQRRLVALPDFVSSFAGQLEPMMILRFELADGTVTHVRLTQLSEDGSWRGVVEATMGETDARVGDQVTVRLDPPGSSLGVSVAEATAGAETAAEVIRATLDQVVPVEGQPFRLEQTYKVEESGSGGQDGGLRCGEDAAPGRVCDEPVLDGHCPVHGEVGPPVGQGDVLLAEANYADSTYYKALSPQESDRTDPWSAPDDGPPTESMSPVGPNVPGVTGQIIADSDDLTDLAEWPRLLATRNGDVYQYQNPRPDGQAEYHCFALMSTFTLAELLTMHGRVWIVDPQTGTDEGTVTS